MIRNEKLLKRLSIIIFIIYILLLFWVIMFKCNLITSFTDTYLFFKDFTIMERIEFHLIPFKDYVEGPFISQINNIIQDDILNLALFIPLGLYLTYFLKHQRLVKVILISFILSSFFEIFQLFSLIGSFSTKDVITNTLGGLIGYFVCKIIIKEHNSTTKIKILNIISIIVIILFIPVVIYAVLNTVKYIDLYIDILKRAY